MEAYDPQTNMRFDGRKEKEPRNIKIMNIGNDTFTVTANMFSTVFIQKKDKRRFVTSSRQNEPVENALLYLKKQPFIFKTFSNGIRDFYEGEVTENYGNIFCEFKKSSKEKIARISFYENEIFVKDVEKMGYDDMLEFL